VPVLEQALRTDAHRAKSARRSGKALFAQIQAQGCSGGYSAVTDFIRVWRVESAKDPARAFVPLSFELGEAFQFDWSDVGFLVLRHVGDANAYVSIYRAGTDHIALVGNGIHFKGSTGEVLREDPPQTAVASVNTFLTGLHLQHFRHWLLRWLYVLGGVAGCACIATSFIFFVEKRKRQQAKQGVTGARWVDAFAVSTVTGIVIAALTMLIGNRLLPTDLAGRGDWEQAIFWGA